jgi:hypothetical protein
MGRNPVCYNYRATLISFRSCLKPLDTFRFLKFVAKQRWEAEEAKEKALKKQAEKDPDAKVQNLLFDA